MPTTVESETAIRELLEDHYATHLNAGDVEAYVGLYAEDVLWSVPNLPDATSPQQIGSLLGKILAKVDQRVTVQVDRVEADDDRAVVTARADGTATRRPDGEPQPLHLRVLWVLRRQDDRWRITHQIGTPKPG